MAKKVKLVSLLCFSILFQAATPGVVYDTKYFPRNITKTDLAIQNNLITQNEANYFITNNHSETINYLITKNVSAVDSNFTNLSALLRDNKLHHPHTNLNTVQIIDRFNYNSETHHVTTADGYILELHRITGRYSHLNQTNKPVILLMHGILASSSDWVIAGPETGLGFILSDRGFDVWMGNARGNVYSKNHTTLKLTSSKFWDFSWHEIGYYDIPAKIDYILEKTGQQKLIYIGHSQGTTVFYVMASERAEYNDKIHKMISFAPVAYSGRMFSPLLQYLSKYIYLAKYITQLIGFHSIEPTNKFIKLATNLLCSDNSLMQTVCLNLIFMICGFDKAQMNMTLLPAIMNHLPAGSSVKQFIHYGQIIHTGKFQKFDYGFVKNWIKYNSVRPPLYQTSNIKAPIVLYYSYNDWLSHPEDVNSLYKTLRNPIGKFKVLFDKFNHLDYLWAKDVKSLLYKDLLKMIDANY